MIRGWREQKRKLRRGLKLKRVVLRQHHGRFGGGLNYVSWFLYYIMEIMMYISYAVAFWCFGVLCHINDKKINDVDKIIYIQLVKDTSVVP